jgi:hypothetical protein
VQLFKKIKESLAGNTTQSGPLDPQLIEAEEAATFDSEVISEPNDLFDGQAEDL